MNDVPAPNSPVSWRDVYSLVGELRADINRDLGRIEGGLETINRRLGTIEIKQASDTATDALEDTLTQRRATAFRWQVGIGATVFFSGAGLLLTIAHIVLHMGG